MGKVSTHRIEKTVTYKTRLDYLLHIPSGDVPSGGHPCIVFLHGAGERGDDLAKVRKHGIPRVVDERSAFPFVTISPQCPTGIRWFPDLIDDVNALVDHALDAYPIDPTRIYLTGLSMGGQGTWGVAAKYAERFAAIAAVCGRSDHWIASRAKHIAQRPVQVFHGDKDETVPISHSERMTRVLREAGADLHYTVYRGVAHDSWTATYANDELYAWFLSHRLNG
ncbi:MAG: prolyl oligopeptidase family serine peptidase [Candidatus Poribacteria bacterium]|nr:prolyl oligopeptidase family serine peptidase [Candidatus Poribacteria bacterium]